MKRANSKLIGAFVFGAALLFLGAVFLFGSRDAFKKKNCFVAYFEQSVTGLNVGDPVKFRGVKVGSVAKLDGIYDPVSHIVYPRVILDFQADALKNSELEMNDAVLFQTLVDTGMRATLKQVSFVTGQLYVSLDFHMENEPRYLGAGDDNWPEMPTIDSGLGQILSAIEGLPLDQLVSQVTSTLSAIEGIVASKGIEESTDYLPTLLASVNATLNSVGSFTDTELPETTKQLRTTLASGENSITKLTDKLTNETLVTLDESMVTLTTQLSTETLVDLDKAMKKFEEAMGQLDLTLSTAQGRLDPKDPLTYELTNTLREVARTSASLKSFTDYLEAHPESIIRGR